MSNSPSSCLSSNVFCCCFVFKGIHCIIKKYKIRSNKAKSSPVTNVGFLLLIDTTLIISMNVYMKNKVMREIYVRMVVYTD